MEIYTPGYWKGRDSAEDFKIAATRKMAAITQLPWVNKEDIYEANIRNPAANILSVPVCWPNVGFIGEYYVGYGYRPYIQGGAITTFEGMVNARLTGRFESAFRTWTAPVTVGSQWSLLFSEASLPDTSGTFTTVAGVAPNSTRTGAIKISTPITGNTKYLYQAGVGAASSNIICMMTDILFGSSGLSLNSSGVLAVASTLLTRYNSTVDTAADFAGGNLATVFISSALAVASSGVLSSYTDQSGNVGNVSQEFPITSGGTVNTLRPLSQFALGLGAGDLGVLSIQEYFNRIASPTSGSVGLVIHRPVVFIPTISTQGWAEKEFILGPEAMVPIQLGTDGFPGCYSLMALADANAPGAVTFYSEWVEG